MGSEVVRMQRFNLSLAAIQGIPKGVYMRYSAYWIETVHGLTTINPGDYVATYPDGRHDILNSGLRAGLAVPKKKGN